MANENAWNQRPLGRRIGVGRWITALLIVLFSQPIARAQTDYATATAALNSTALQVGGQAAIAIVLDVKPEFHAQSHTPHDPDLIPCVVDVDENPSITFRDPIYPPGKDESYPSLGVVSVYTGRTVIYIPVMVKADAKPGGITLSGTLHFQACNSDSCFPPNSLPFKVNTKVVAATDAVEAINSGYFAGYKMPASTPPASTPPALASPINSPAPAEPLSFWRVLLLAFTAGLLFNIMPCVLPVLPLKAIGFYEVSQHRRGRSIALGIVFSLGLISVFAVLALFVLVLKQITWGGLFSKGWFVWSIVSLLVVLSMGLFGGWNLRLPLGVYTIEPRHDTFGGNYFWGALTAILATPCTAPLLPVVLGWAATQPIYLGVPAMLMVGVGMSSPYLLLSATPELARRFPRSGPWPDLFKQMMGFMMLAAAAYFGGGRLVSGLGFWWIVTAVVAVASFYLVARSVQLTRNGLPVAICATLAVGMLGGSLWWTTQITGLFMSGSTGTSVEQAWQPYTADALAKARSDGKTVLVKFTANWCGTCQYIEGTVFRDPAVWDYLKKHGVVALKADFSNDNPQGDKLLRSLNPAGGIPLTAIYPSDGGPPVQIASVYSTDTLMKVLEQINVRRIVQAD